MDVVGILINDEHGDLNVSGVYISPPPVNMDSDSDFTSEDQGHSQKKLRGAKFWNF